MHFVRVSFFAAALVILGGCASLDCKPVVDTALPGTDTAIVGLYLDKDGYPQATVEKITVHPGQRVLFAGPNQFDILFKDNRSPIGKLEVKSSNGIVVIEIPRDILERNQTAATAPSPDVKKGLSYRYGIRANGKVTDPTIHVIPR